MEQPGVRDLLVPREPVHGFHSYVDILKVRTLNHLHKECGISAICSHPLQDGDAYLECLYLVSKPIHNYIYVGSM